MLQKYTSCTSEIQYIKLWWFYYTVKISVRHVMVLENFFALPILVLLIFFPGIINSRQSYKYNTL